MMQGGFMETVADTLHASGVSARDIELELTESASLETDAVTIRRIEDLRSIGVSIAIDDFGIGYSTFAYLTRFPINRLKIDKSLLRDLVEGRQDRTVTHAIIDLGHRLGLSVTVEGIETCDQLEVVRQLGGDEGQGFLFGQPMAGEALADFLRLHASGDAEAPWRSRNAGARASSSYGYDI
jgi:EAL domain-containing protein (putative c-di-GMP-specific phosphodiesterase class I)